MITGNATPPSARTPHRRLLGRPRWPDVAAPRWREGLRRVLVVRVPVLRCPVLRPPLRARQPRRARRGGGEHRCAGRRRGPLRRAADRRGLRRRRPGHPGHRRPARSAGLSSVASGRDRTSRSPPRLRARGEGNPAGAGRPAGLGAQTATPVRRRRWVILAAGEGIARRRDLASTVQNARDDHRAEIGTARSPSRPGRARPGRRVGRADDDVSLTGAGGQPVTVPLLVGMAATATAWSASPGRPGWCCLTRPRSPRCCSRPSTSRPTALD